MQSKKDDAINMQKEAALTEVTSEPFCHTPITLKDINYELLSDITIGILDIS